MQVAVLQRSKDPDRLMSLVKKEENLVPRLGILAVDLDASFNSCNSRWIRRPMRALVLLAVSRAADGPRCVEILDLHTLIQRLRSSKFPGASGPQSRDQ